MDGNALRSQVASNICLLREGVKLPGERMDIDMSRDAAGKFTAWVFVKMPGQIPAVIVKGAASVDAWNALNALLNTTSEIVEQRCQLQFEAFMAEEREEFGEGGSVLTALLEGLPAHQQPANQGA